MWILYECLLVIGLLLYIPKAVWRGRLPHRGWSMRLGRFPDEMRQRLGSDQAIWMHAVSVGEVQAIQPLARALAQRHPNDPLVISTITPTGFTVASKLLSDHAIIAYFPLDVRWCVRRTLDALHPRCLVLVESEFWPNMIRLAKARGIPMVVVNGRISLRAFQRYRLVAPWLRHVLGHIDVFLMQTQADADRAIAIGAPPDRVQVLGSLKWDASLTAKPSSTAVSELAKQIGCNGQERVLVAGSTHRGEEEALLKTFTELRTVEPALRLIMAPRHLERLAEVEALVRERGLNSRRLSRPESADWDVGLVDTFGQLPLYYGMASVVFVGGSLIPHGGQNPLEAASVGKPIVFGPFMQNFHEIAEQLVSHGAARQLADRAELGRTLQQLLTDRQQAEELGRRAQELVGRLSGVTSRTLDALIPLLGV